MPTPRSHREEAELALAKAHAASAVPAAMQAWATVALAHAQLAALPPAPLTSRMQLSGD